MISLRDPLQLGNTPDHSYCAIFFRKKKNGNSWWSKQVVPPFPECAGFSSPLPWRGWPPVTGKYVFDHSKVLEMLNTKFRFHHFVPSEIFVILRNFRCFFSHDHLSISIDSSRICYQNLIPISCTCIGAHSAVQRPRCPPIPGRLARVLREMTQVGIMPRIMINFG